MTVKKTITLKKDLIKKLDALALKQNRTFSNLMETIAIFYLNNNKK